MESSGAIRREPIFSAAELLCDVSRENSSSCAEPDRIAASSAALHQPFPAKGPRETRGVDAGHPYLVRAVAGLARSSCPGIDA